MANFLKSVRHKLMLFVQLEFRVPQRDLVTAVVALGCSKSRDHSTALKNYNHIVFLHWKADVCMSKNVQK